MPVFDEKDGRQIRPDNERILVMVWDSLTASWRAISRCCSVPLVYAKPSPTSGFAERTDHQLR